MRRPRVFFTSLVVVFLALLLAAGIVSALTVREGPEDASAIDPRVLEFAESLGIEVGDDLPSSILPNSAIAVAYDSNGDGIIDISEMFHAVDDYVAGELSISDLFVVIEYYFSGKRLRPAPTNTPVPPTSAPTPTPTPTDTPGELPVDPFAIWNGLEPQDWWRESEPYTCQYPEKSESPWIDAGMVDLGGSDPLSLIKYYGNGSYMRYGYMGFGGCTLMKKYPDLTYLDPPVDPTYYSLGELNIAVDIARVPPDAPGWYEDDGKRESMTMAEAVKILNTHVASYFGKISEGNLRMRFHAGNDFELEGEGSPNDVHGQQMRLAGIMDCRGKAADKYPCDLGAPGGIDRILFTDVTTDTGGDAFNGSARMGLVSLREENMESLVHEIGHGWMMWPHSFAEVRWDEDEDRLPNPYSNHLDFMSSIAPLPPMGWHQDMPSTLAVNRYAAGWIDPKEVALHLGDAGTYTLQPPRQRGYQFLVISSGRKHAFTTVEVLDERNPVYVDGYPVVYTPSGDRPFRYDGVLVSRYDQSAGTGINARSGPALYDERNPDFSSDVNRGYDDFSVIQDGETRDIGSGIRLEVNRNDNGSYDVAVSGGRVAEFTQWCNTIWFAFGEYDMGCALNDEK